MGDREERRQNLVPARAISDDIFQVIFMLSHLQSLIARIILIDYP